jgi:hypothetical protein
LSIQFAHIQNVHFVIEHFGVHHVCLVQPSIFRTVKISMIDFMQISTNQKIKQLFFVDFERHEFGGFFVSNKLHVLL